MSVPHHARARVYAHVMEQTNPPIKNKQWQTRKWIFRGRSHLAPRLGGRGDVYLHKGIGSDCHRRVPNLLPRLPQTLKLTSPIFLHICSLSFYLLEKSMLKERSSLFLSRTMDQISPALILASYSLFLACTLKNKVLRKVLRCLLVP